MVEEGRAIKRFGRDEAGRTLSILQTETDIERFAPPAARIPAMALPGLFWIELGLGVVLLLLAAKVHGRQIRLERELEGYMEIGFMKENPPWVESLWRKDRRQYWATFSAAAAVLAASVLLTGSPGLSAKFGTDPMGNPAAGAVAVAITLWAPSAAFIGNGMTSVGRLLRRLREPRPDGRRRDEVRAARGPWLKAAIRGTLGYWGLVAAFTAVAIGLLAVG